MSMTTQRREPSRSWLSRLCATNATFYGPSSTHSTSPTCSPDGHHPELSKSRPTRMSRQTLSSRAPHCDWLYQTLCHPERSIAIGTIHHNAKSRDLLFLCSS